jgi:hypothetical protein
VRLTGVPSLSAAKATRASGHAQGRPVAVAGWAGLGCRGGLARAQARAW